MPIEFLDEEPLRSIGGGIEFLDEEPITQQGAIEYLDDEPEPPAIQTPPVAQLPQKRSDIQQAAPQPAERYSLVKDVAVDTPVEIAKGGTRGTEQLLGSVGSGIQAGSEYLESLRRSANVAYNEFAGGKLARTVARLRGLDLNAPAPQTLTAEKERITDKGAEFGKEIADFWNTAASTGWEKRTEDIYGGTLIENPSLARVVGGAAESAPSMLIAMGLSAVGAPGLGATVLAGSEALPEYTRARELGVSPEEALKNAVLSGMGTAVLEKVSLGVITGKSPVANELVKKMGRKWVAGAVVNYAAEGSQEALQEIYQNAIAMGYDGDRELLDGALEAFVTGGLVGTVAGGASKFQQNYLKKQAKQAEKLTREEVAEKVRESEPLSEEAIPPTQEELDAEAEAFIEYLDEEATDVAPPVEETLIDTTGLVMDEDLQRQAIEAADREQPIAPQTEQEIADQEAEAFIEYLDEEVAPEPDAVAEEVADPRIDGGIKDVRAVASEVGVEAPEGISMTGLRQRVKKAVFGGMIDNAVATDKGKKEHPYIQQQRRNDKRVDAWSKKHAKDSASSMGALFVDRAGDVKKSLDELGASEAIQKMVLRQGNSAQASLLLRDAQNAIDKVMPRRYNGALKDYINAKRTVEATELQAGRGVELKSPQEASDARNWLDTEFANMPENKRAKVEAAAEIYWTKTREQLDALYDAELIGEEAYNSLIENHRYYSPRLFVDYIDPITTTPIGEKKHDSGVDALGEGSTSALIQDPSYLLAHVISRTQSRVFKNRANRTLFDLARNNPDNGLVRIAENSTDLKRGEENIGVFVGGEKVFLAMPAKMAEQWDGVPPILSNNVAEILQWASGTKPLKALATGVNPEFFISNLPRDAMYAWFNAGEYSNIPPVGMLQLGADYSRVMKDSIKRTGAYRDYVAEGGGLDYLTTQGVGRRSALKKGATVANKIGDVLAWAGETSEIATRLAVRDRAIRNGATGEQATYVARNMLDFSQGGTVSKAADNIFPYLNAAIQGTRGGFRTFKTDPVGATLKASQLVAFGYVMARTISAIAPELWESISDREKATKWIIPLPFKETDKAGNPRRAYLAIPKDQFQQMFAAAGQVMSDAHDGREWDGQVLNALTQAIPVDMVSSLPPVANAWMAYFKNYDTWKQEDVWRGYEDLDANKERTAYTPELANKISDVARSGRFKISPDRLTAASSKIIPTSNPIGPLLATAFETGDNELGKTMVEKVRETPVLRRLLRFSGPTEPTARTKEEASRVKADVEGLTELDARRVVKETRTDINNMRQDMNIQLDEFMTNKEVDRGDIVREIRNIAPNKVEAQRLWQRAKSKDPKKARGNPF